MTVAAADRPRRASTLAVFAVLAALTVAEILVAASGVYARLRTTALAGLLMAKAGILLAFSLRATWRRPATRLVLLSLLAATGFTIVLMLEAVYRAGIR
jgi:cytochrome c oxidase subunit IV